MTIPIGVICVVFVLFVVLHVWRHGDAASLERAGLLERFKGLNRVRYDDADMRRTWIFSVIALAVVLLASSASWLVRAAVFVGVLLFLGVATIAIRRRSR